jgi:fatty acid desaturase
VAHAGSDARKAGELSGAGGATAKAVHPLVADLMRVRPAFYWADLVASAAAGWGSLIASSLATSAPLAALLFAISVLALYRAVSFIHEITHLPRGAVPGFALGWNALVGVPLLLPSMLYVGVHGIHHAKAHYGTHRDPEYRLIGRWPAWRIVLWVLHAGLLPVALVLRFLLLAPLSLLHPRLRDWVWARASSMSINPAFVRPPAQPGQRLAALAQEIACFIWSLALAVATATGLARPRSVLFALAAGAAMSVVNQLRTAVAHRFRNTGATLTSEEQFLDSVNVTGNPAITSLWAPVGLRFHALHHLLPGLPYHALGEAHRRIVEALPADAAYRLSNESTLAAALRELFQGSTEARAGVSAGSLLHRP